MTRPTHDIESWNGVSLRRTERPTLPLFGLGFKSVRKVVMAYLLANSASSLILSVGISHRDALDGSVAELVDVDLVGEGVSHFVLP